MAPNLLPAREFPPGLDWLNTAQPLTFAQLKGKIVLLDFWTYGCINCIHVIPDLKQLEAEYPNELVVIGIHSAKFDAEGETENIRQIILRYELEHPIVNDRNFRIWQRWDVHAWPTAFLIDPAGKVVERHSGEGFYAVFKPLIASLVESFAAKGQLDLTPFQPRLEKAGLPKPVLAFPGKVFAEQGGERLFIADTNHHRLIVAHQQTGEVLDLIGSGAKGFTDGDFGTATFAHPQGLVLAPDGQTLYVADSENHALREIDLATSQVTTLVGTGHQSRQFAPRGGKAPAFALNSPWDLALEGQKLYIAMAGMHQIWLLDLVTKALRPFAGSGREGTVDSLCTSAELAQPSGLALDGQARLYFADAEGSSIRWADLHGPNPQVHTLAGSGSSLFDFGDRDGLGPQARFQHPLGVAYQAGMLYLTDTYNHKIKQIEPKTGAVQTFLGQNSGWRDGIEPLFAEPGGLSAAEKKLFVADTNNHAIRVIDLSTKNTTTLILKGLERFMPAPESEAFPGKMLQLAAQTVEVGEGSLEIELRLPEGYKLNPAATHALTWQATAGLLLQPTEANLSFNQPTLSMPLIFRAGSGQLICDLTLFYCAGAKEGVCLLDQVRLTIPLTVQAVGEKQCQVVYQLQAA